MEQGTFVYRQKEKKTTQAMRTLLTSKKKRGYVGPWHRVFLSPRKAKKSQWGSGGLLAVGRA
eukprot:959887-Pelagomonas_calceolata.AAC.1